MEFAFDDDEEPKGNGKLIIYTHAVTRIEDDAAGYVVFSFDHEDVCSTLIYIAQKYYAELGITNNWLLYYVGTTALIPLSLEDTVASQTKVPDLDTRCEFILYPRLPRKVVQLKDFRPKLHVEQPIAVTTINGNNNNDDDDDDNDDDYESNSAVEITTTTRQVNTNKLTQRDYVIDNNNNGDNTVMFSVRVRDSDVEEYRNVCSKYAKVDLSKYTFTPWRKQAWVKNVYWLTLSRVNEHGELFDLICNTAKKNKERRNRWARLDDGKDSLFHYACRYIKAAFPDINTVIEPEPVDVDAAAAPEPVEEPEDYVGDYDFGVGANDDPISITCASQPLSTADWLTECGFKDYNVDDLDGPNITLHPAGCTLLLRIIYDPKTALILTHETGGLVRKHGIVIFAVLCFENTNECCTFVACYSRNLALVVPEKENELLMLHAIMKLKGMPGFPAVHWEWYPPLAEICKQPTWTRSALCKRLYPNMAVDDIIIEPEVTKKRARDDDDDDALKKLCAAVEAYKQEYPKRKVSVSFTL